MHTGLSVCPYQKWGYTNVCPHLANVCTRPGRHHADVREGAKVERDTRLASNGLACVDPAAISCENFAATEAGLIAFTTNAIVSHQTPL